MRESRKREKRELYTTAQTVDWQPQRHLEIMIITPESASAWMKERRIYRSLLQNKRESFWMRKIDAEKSSPRPLRRSIDVLLGRGGVPSCDNIDVAQFHDYFDAKVAGVQSSTDGASPPSFATSSSDVHFTCFCVFLSVSRRLPNRHLICINFS